MFLLTLLTISGFSWCSDSYRILSVNPFPGKSHSIPIVTLNKALAKKGHEVTSISFFPLNKPMRNHNDVDLGEKGNPYRSFMDLRSFKQYRGLLTVSLIQNYSKILCEETFTSEPLQTFLNKSETNFDLIILNTFVSDCYLSFMHKFKAPLVGFSTFSLLQPDSRKVGNIMNPSIVPNLNLGLPKSMNFWERLENFLYFVYKDFIYDFYMLPRVEKNTRKYFDDLPSLTDLIYNTSLLLVNSHTSLSFPQPLVPGVVEVGGIHLEEVRELPQNLEKWINESTHGVIYFSLGSMIKGHTFPEEKRQEFLKAFGRLPQRVLWKYENETMPGKPDNVMIQKWMPQLDILCHPNVKAFISHGGLLGTTEAVHCGVPVMVMPQYGDQFTNAKALEANGGGVILHLYEATEDKVYDALKTILDPKFKKQAEDLSARFRDRPLPPLETAIYWVEYVARHRGAPHMRTAAVGMPLYKYLLLDVIAFLLLVVALASALSFYVARAVLRKLFGAEDKQKTN